MLPNQISTISDPLMIIELVIIQNNLIITQLTTLYESPPSSTGVHTATVTLLSVLDCSIEY